MSQVMSSIQLHMFGKMFIAFSILLACMNFFFFFSADFIQSPCTLAHACRTIVRNGQCQLFFQMYGICLSFNFLELSKHI